MGSDAAKVSEMLQYSSGIKMHSLMCTELLKFVDRISQIFPAIESARPRCNSGLESLCSLNLAMEKAKLLLQHCTESSKLYLAITGDAIMLRCERVRNALEQSLSQIQNLVPLLLAAQISAIVDGLKSAKFIMGHSEEKAGKVLLALLRQASDSTEASEFEAFEIAALRLHITSQKALLIERRAIKKLLVKLSDADQAKERILKYLLYLVRKYGKSIRGEQTMNPSAQYEGLCSSTRSARNGAVHDQSIAVPEDQVDDSSRSIPPEEFRCPISLKLMYDPVVISSGQTFERVSIEKWFNDGHDTCPKTQTKLSHLSITPNSVMKDLISKWCQKQGISIADPTSQPIHTSVYSWKSSSSSSIASFSSSLNDVPIRIYDSSISFGSSVASSDSSQIKIVNSSNSGSPEMNDDPPICQSSNFSQGMNSDTFSKLSGLPWDSQCKAVEDVKNHLKENGQALDFMLSSSFVESMLKFLKDACDRYDVKAQRVGAEMLLIFASNSRNEIPSLCEDIFYILASFLDSEITEEALAIMQVLSASPCCISSIVASGALPSIIKILDSQTREFQGPAIKVLYNLSSYSNIRSHVLYLGCIPKLIYLLGDNLLALAGDCIKILRNLCDSEEGRIAVAEADGCITSIVELLETGTHEEQEHAVAVLLTLCSHQLEYCELVLKEGVIPSLVHMSINGNSKGKESAMKLLQLLREIRCSDSPESLPPPTELSCNSGICFTEKQPSSKAHGFFGRKIRIFSKPRSLTLF